MKLPSRPRTTANLPESVHQQLNAYALAAGAAGVSSRIFHPAEDKPDSAHRRLNPYALAATAAGVGLLALAQSAEAKIVYTPANATITSSGVAIDLNHDGVADFDIGYIYLARAWNLDAVPQQASNAIVDHWSHGKRFAAALKKGVMVGPEGPFHRGQLPMAGSYHGTGSGGHSGPWWGLNGQRYLGLKFVVNGKTHYGWARIKGKQTRPRYTLTGYAYETIPNKPILTGQTQGPDEIGLREPQAPLTVPTRKSASLGILAMGAPGLSIWREESVVLRDNQLE
jgi:hypothetical protein